MGYRDNITELAARLGISNNPGLREVDIKIAEMYFTTLSGDTVEITATDMNRGGRMFFQSLMENGSNKIVIVDAFRSKAAKFFAELWEPNPVPGKRKLLDAIRASSHVEIFKK
jgi:hypothetical protein